MDFTFYNSYLILELVSSTVIFWTELRCWRKGYSSKTTLLLGWSHRYKNSTGVITIISNDNISFTFYEDVSFQFLLPKFYGLHCIYEYHDGCLIRSMNCLPFASTWVHPLPQDLGGVRAAYLFRFLCCVVRYDNRIKRCSVRLYLQLFVGGCMSYLRYLCLLAHSGVQHIWCCVFVLFFFVLCGLCCQFLWIVLFLIAPSVFSNVYLIQFYI